MVRGKKMQNEPIPLFLKEVFFEGLSGRLSLEGEGYQKNLFFSEGKLVYAQSSRFDEKILVILHLVGKISEEQYNFIGGMHQFLDDQVANVLLEHQFVKKKDLYYARIYQFRRIALSTFSIQRVNWQFKILEPPPEQKENYEIPLAGILVEGARLIDRVSPYAGMWLFHIAKPLGGIPEQIAIYFTEEEQAFFSRLLEYKDMSCREIIARLNVQPLDFWRKTLAFHLLGALNLQKGPVGVDMDRDFQELLSLHEKIRSGTLSDLDLLGISPDSSQTSIEEAHAQLRTRFAPERFGSAAAPETKKIAEAVCQHIDAALQRLISLPRITTPLPAASAPAREVTPQDRARDLYMKGKELYEKNEIMNAIEALKLAIKIDPTQGDFYYLLGMCQAEISVLAYEAEINLKKAIELQPWSADPIYALGKLFHKQNKLKLAERCFQRVNEISREHSGAGQAMINLRRQKPEKKDKLAFLKKKIF